MPNPEPRTREEVRCEAVRLYRSVKGVTTHSGVRSCIAAWTIVRCVHAGGPTQAMDRCGGKT